MELNKVNVSNKLFNNKETSSWRDSVFDAGVGSIGAHSFTNGLDIQY